MKYENFIPIPNFYQLKIFRAEELVSIGGVPVFYVFFLYITTPLALNSGSNNPQIGNSESINDRGRGEQGFT